MPGGMQFLGGMKSVSTSPSPSTLFSAVSLRHRRRRNKDTTAGSGSGSDSAALGRAASFSTSGDSADSMDTPPTPALSDASSPEMRPRSVTHAASLPAQQLPPPQAHPQQRRQLSQPQSQPHFAEPPQLHQPSLPRQHDMAVRGSMPLDTISKSAPPHVAVRYGDTIRLFARSKYAGAGAAGGYVGTFEAGKRFLASKNPAKQGELACVPPVAPAAAKQYNPSSFVILSNCGMGVGTPVSYGDVVVLVDAAGRVWNNKMGVGPSTKSGCFGPRDPNTPGEMYLSFYQLQANEDGAQDSSSESSDDEDNFVFFSNLARSTKNMAETTFGKPTQTELNVAAAAMRTMGKVMYYGDRNLVIEVADSNRMRSKFNRVITHFSKPHDAPVVQGGFLRCDGRGKTILFEMHGQELPTITSIDISEARNAGHSYSSSHRNSTADAAQEQVHHGDNNPNIRVSLSTQKDVAVGVPLAIQDVRRSTMLSLHFSDGGRVRIPCQRFLKHEGRAFYRVVLNGKRPLRVLVRGTRAVDRKKVDLRGTLRGTYRQIFKLSCGIVLVYLGAASVFTHVFGSVVVLPAVYTGLTAAVLAFLVEVFFPGKLVAARQVNREDTHHSGHELGNWQFTVVALEASDAERLEVDRTAMDKQTPKQPKKVVSFKVPRSFLVAENEDVVKATERYEATLAWRKEVLADSILTMPQTHYETIKTHYTQYLHKHDKLGHPVYYEKIGSINMAQLKKEGIAPDDLFRHYLFAMEFTLKYAAHECCSCDACAHSDTQKLCIVLDARGLGMRDMGGEAFEFIRRCTGVMQRHYPQRSFKIFFVNVPSWFGMAWKGVKPLLNEATRAKTNILTESETAAGLLEFIDAENLPAEYGGTCACPGGCDTNSAYQQLQKELVQSVLQCKPFECDDLVRSIAQDRAGESRTSGEQPMATVAAPASPPPPVMAPMKRESSNPAAAVLDQLFRGGSGSSDADTFSLNDRDDGFGKTIPPGLFSEEVLKAGYLLQRSLRHKQFNPIWHRQLFILHPHFLRFAKTLDAEVFQMVSLTPDTLVRKTLKQNNSFELVTPLMAANGHSLLLYAPSPAALSEWVDVISEAIKQLKPKPTTSGLSPSPSPLLSPELSPVASPKANKASREAPTESSSPSPSIGSD